MATGSGPRVVAGKLAASPLGDRYSCDGCGAVFSSKHGPANIYDTPKEASSDAVRAGECPVCDEDEPTMHEVK